MSVLEFAQDYVQRGISVIPVPFKTKNPVLEGWQRLRVSESDLADYFNGAKQNVGGLMGEPSGGVVDVDLDADEALIAAEFLLPATPAIFGRESKRRSHRLYRINPIVDTKKWVDPILAGRPNVEDERAMIVELRSSRAQTVLPGSVHPSGESIRWDSDGEPTRLDGEDLRRVIGYVAAAALLARYWPKGARHEAALALAGGLLRGGRSKDDVRRFMEAVARAAGDQEISNRLTAVDDTAARIAKREGTTGLPTLATLIDPRVVDKLREWLHLRVTPSPLAEWEPPTPFPVVSVEPFPIDALPVSLRTYVVAVATETQTPVDLAALLGLAVVAICLQKKVVVHVRRGWIEPTNLYVVVVLPSGNRKSAVVRAVGLPIVEHERNEAERLRADYARATASFKVAEGRADSLRSQAAKAQAVDPTSDEARNLLGAAREAAAEVARMRVPELPRLLVGDATSEAIAKLLAAHGGRIGSIAAEGTLFEVMRGRYSERPNFDVFLNAHAGDDLRVDRVGRPPEIVPHPCLTLGLAVQPDVIRGLVEEKSFRGRGLLARFFYSWPESIVGHRQIEPPAVTGEVLQGYHDLGVKLLATDYAETTTTGQSVSHVLSFSPEGYAAFRDFLAWIEPQLTETGELFALADWASKLAGLVARVAGLFHVLEHASDGQAYRLMIGASTINNAIAVGRYAIAHARRSFAEMGANEKIEDAKYLLSQLAKSDLSTFTKRDLHRLSQGRFSTVDLMDGGLDLLESHGFVRSLPTEERAGAGRKPSPKYEVNPFARFDSVNSVNSVTRDLEPKNDNQSVLGSPDGAIPSDKLDTIDRIGRVVSNGHVTTASWLDRYGDDLTEECYQAVVNADIASHGVYRPTRRYSEPAEEPEEIWRRLGLIVNDGEVPW